MSKLIYPMTPAQTETWCLGGAAAAHVEEMILAELIDEADVDEAVTVVLDDGSVAYALELGGAQ
jgi:hypothetical protein